MVTEFLNSASTDLIKGAKGCQADFRHFPIRRMTSITTPSACNLTWNGKTAPSTYLHKQLDVTPPRPAY